MNTKNKRFLSILTAGMMAVALCLSGCGGSGGAATSEEENALVGNYIAVVGEMWGFSMTGDEMSGFAIELSSGGKGTMEVEGESGSLIWTAEEDALTVKIEGEEMVAQIGENTLTFEDMLGMGLDITFAKEGTDAVNPENYLPEEDKAMLGVWESHTVTDVMGDDASGEVDPAGLTIEFFGDRTATASLNGNDLGATTWSSDFKYFDDGCLLSSWEYAEEGDDILVTYSDEDNYWEFTLSKQG